MFLPMIDWLSATVDIEDYDINCFLLLEQLELLKNQASELRAKGSSEKILFHIGSEVFEVMASGNPSYGYILHNNFLELRLMKYRLQQEKSYPLFIHIKSECLWSKGPEASWKWLYELIESHLGKIIANKVNRADLCCHTDQLTLNIQDIELFKGKYSKDKIDRDNRGLTGLSFGSRNTGTIYARFYNKTQEVLEKKTKGWFFEIWKNNGLDISKVWNMEFEVKRDFFKSVGIESCEDLFNRLQDIWDYCTSQWIVMTHADNKRKDRCSVTQFWELLQKSFADYKGLGQISRTKQIEAEKEALIPSMCGYISSHAAMSNIKNPQIAIMNVWQDLQNYLDKKDTSFDQVVKKKRMRKGLEV